MSDNSDDAIVDLLREMISESRKKDLEILERISEVHDVVRELSIDFDEHSEEEARERERTNRRVEVLETAFINSGRLIP